LKNLVVGIISFGLFICCCDDMKSATSEDRSEVNFLSEVSYNYIVTSNKSGKQVNAGDIEKHLFSSDPTKMRTIADRGSFSIAIEDEYILRSPNEKVRQKVYKVSWKKENGESDNISIPMPDNSGQD
jgi:hypothetical protein